MRTRSVVAGTIGGLVSGLTGLGGGTVLVPLLTGLLHLPQRRAHATSLAIVIFIAVAAAALYVGRDEVDWGLAAGVAVGGALGAQAGARVLRRTSDQHLRLAFGVFLTLVGLRLVVLG